MKNNILFIIIAFMIISSIFIIFPHEKKLIKNNNKNDKIIKITNTNDYAAKILLNDNVKIKNNLNDKNYNIFNIKLTDKNNIQKNIFNFNEEILLNFDYEIPNDKFIFKLDFDLEFEFFQKQDIVRKGKGNTNKSPLIFKVINYNNNTDDLQLENINIQVFKTNNYENPAFVYSHKIDIIIEKKKINNEMLSNNENNLNLEIIQNNKLDVDANKICNDIINNYNYDELKIHIPILEYCSHQGIKKAKEYIEKYYENQEINN